MTQSNLLNLAGRLGPDWPAVALHLGLSYRELQRIRHEFRCVPLSLWLPRWASLRPGPLLPGGPLRLLKCLRGLGGAGQTSQKGMVWPHWPREQEAGPGWVW